MKAGWLRPGYRRSKWLLPIWLLIGVGLSVVVFVVFWNKKVHSQKVDLDGRCINAAILLQANLMSTASAAGMYNGLIHAFPEISTADFETYADFTNFIIPFGNGISYMRYVPGPQRSAFESLLGVDFTQYAPHDTSSSVPAFVPRENASEYLISWRMSNRAYQAFFSGFDLLSEPGMSELALFTRDTGQPQVSGPFPAPLDRSTSLAVLWPIYTRNFFLHKTVAARRANFKGVVMALFDVQNLFDNTASKFKTTVMELSIFDITNATDPIHGGVRFYNITKSGDKHGRRFSSTQFPQRSSGRSYRVECGQYVSVSGLLTTALAWSCSVLLVFIVLAAFVFFIVRKFRRDQEAVQRVEKLNEELELARQTAESADKAKSSFLAMMSHELRTPMTGTLGMLDLLRLTAMTDEQCLYVTTMQSSAESLLACLNDILDFSKIEAGQLRLEEIDFDISDVVQQVTTLFSGKLQEKGLQIRTNLPPPLECKARGDPLRLQQVLTNLLSNAIKFTDQGNITIHWRRLNGAQLSYRGGERASFSSFPADVAHRDDVAVGIDPILEPLNDGDKAPGCLESLLRRRRLRTLSRADSESSDGVKSGSSGFQGSPHSSVGPSDSDGLWYEFGVSDTGLGITPEVQQRLFRSFVQADNSTTRMFGGTGLGLVICKKLVTAMGGSISVDSQVGQGSTFTCVVCLRPQRPGSPSTAELQPSDRLHTDRVEQLSNQRFATSEISDHHSPRTPERFLPEIQPGQTTRFTDHVIEPGKAIRPDLETVREARSGEADREAVSTTEPGLGTSITNGPTYSTTGFRGNSVERNGSHFVEVSGSDSREQNRYHTETSNGESVTGHEGPSATSQIHPIVMGQTERNARAHKAENVTDGARVRPAFPAAEPLERPDTFSTSQQMELVGVKGHVSLDERPTSVMGSSTPSIPPAVGAGSSRQTKREVAGPAHILVAEDNLVNQMLIKRMLGQFGHSVDIVGNGALAVSAVQAHDYALCLMDLQMPVLDGIGATEQIRRLDSPKCDLPIYVLSADVLAQNKLSPDLRFDGYLTKPIKWDVLLATVEERLKAKGVMKPRP